MKTSRESGSRIGKTALAVALGVGLATGAQAQAAEPNPRGPVEGIKVHGQWTIEVRNPDGSLASRSEFKNRLALPGDEPYSGAGNRILAGLLGRAGSVGLWEIHLHNSNVELCFDAAAQVTHGCVIAEPGSTANGSNYFKVLAIATDLQAGTVTLRGTARMNACETCSPRAISHVGTALRTCAASTAPSSPCTSSGDGGNFTKTEIPNPPTVSFGQAIDVTVVLSFS